MNGKASYYIRAMIGLAAIAAATAVAGWHGSDPALFALCAVLALAANTWKIWIPNVDGNVSAGFVFLLIAMGQFGWSETVAMAFLSGLVQSLFRKRTPPKPIQVAFNTSVVVVVAAATHLLVSAAVPDGSPFSILMRLVLASIVLFLLNSVAIALLLYLMGKASPRDTMRQIQIWVAPYYVTGGIVAATVVESNLLSSAWAGLPLLPVVAFAYLYYKQTAEAAGRSPSTK